MNEQVFEPLNQSDSVLIKPEVIISDGTGKQLCRGLVEWQIKSWQKVKTKA